MPHILGNDVVGVVAEVGAAVRHVKVGRSSAACCRRSRAACAPRAWPATTTCAASYDVLGRRRNGGYAEKVAVPARELPALPGAT